MATRVATGRNGFGLIRALCGGPTCQPLRRVAPAFFHELPTEGRHYSRHTSGGGSVVLVDKAAEPVAAADLVRRRSFWSLDGFGCPEFEGTMRPLAVVVVDVDAEHAFEVTAVEDQQPVETLGTYGPDEALRDRVCLRRSHWCPHDPG